MTKVRSTAAIAAILAASLFSFAGCNGTGNPNSVIDGSILEPGTPDNPGTPPAEDPNPNPNVISIAVKYVALQPDAATAASPTQAAVQDVVKNMSAAWAQCEIEFILEEYVPAVAGDLGLDYTPANHSQLDAMRSKFDDGKHALFVKTGTWDRSGNLGYDGSNGFSTMPGSDPEGIVFESQVATSKLLLSHEAGHLVGGLDHTSSTTNLMNHFVTSATTMLSDSQCESARNTAWDYHSAWIR